MFDVGFWEIIVIMVVALLVVGPERLPRLARTAGLWVGKARRFVHSVKADIDRELATEELRRTLAKQAELPELQELFDEKKPNQASSQRAKPEPNPEYLVTAPKDEKPVTPESPAATNKSPHDGTT